jgi:anti-anti-sigma factor
VGVTRGRLLGVPAVILSGEIDRAVMPELQPMLSSFVDRVNMAHVLERARAPILLDFTDLTFVDSAFISVTYDILEQLPEGCPLCAVNPSSSVVRVFELAGLLSQPGFRVFATPKDAAKGLGWRQGGGETAA